MKNSTAVLMAGALALGSAAAMPPQASAAQTGCRVDYTVVSQWAGGFTGDIEITNLGDPLTEWSLGFDFPHDGQEIAHGWNATWSQSGDHVTATSRPWNGALATGSSVSLGFTGTWSTANPDAVDLTLNGVPCDGEPSDGTDVLARAHTAGRVQTDGDAARYSWPGVYFEGRFRGTGVGIVLDDPAADYDVQIDGEVATTLVTPSEGTHWIDGLTGGEHTVRVVKRSESPWATSTFGGFAPAPGGEILDRPAARDRQIEFIGDSYTAGYGNLSETRDCTGDEVNRSTNADLGFGALTARELDADFQINAYSGLGMVRNYNGERPEVDYRTFHDRALLDTEGDVWQRPDDWRPQLVVVGLGINDFSTDINPGEPWTPDSLVAAYESAYHGFLDQLRDQYGAETVIVVSATHMSNTTLLADTAERIVESRNDQGDERIRYWYYDDAGLDYLGCHWHPSAHDHELIADRLGEFVATLPLDW